MDRDLPADFAAGIVGAFQTKLNVGEQGRRVVSATGSYTATAPLFQDGRFYHANGGLSRGDKLIFDDSFPRAAH